MSSSPHHASVENASSLRQKKSEVHDVRMPASWPSGKNCARMTGKYRRSPGGSSVVEQWTVKRLVQRSIGREFKSPSPDDGSVFFVPEHFGAAHNGRCGGTGCTPGCGRSSINQDFRIEFR